MNRIQVLSPAKINLFLQVTGKRPDGFHGLYTLFHRISLSDRMIFKKTRADGLSLQCSHPDVPTDQSNIVARAYAELKALVPSLGGVRVTLQKKIPVGAGLGGGSSNAASFLMAMNRLFDLKLSRRRLLSIGRRLGADVPFFLYDTNQAIAEGRGDVIRPRPTRSVCHFVLVMDAEPLSTAEVFSKARFSASGASLTKESGAVRMLCAFLDRGRVQEIYPYLRNDLEDSAFRIRSSIQKRKAMILRHGLNTVKMSGSGPTLFLLLPQKSGAGAIVKKLRQEFPQNRVELVHTQ